MTGKKQTAPPWVSTPLPNQTRRPQLRCPGCGSTFTPPAETCPDCRVDLRLGRRRKRQLLPDWLQLPPEIMRPLKAATIIGLTLALGGAAVSGFHGYLNRPRPRLRRCQGPRIPSSAWPGNTRSCCVLM